ncbi:calcium-transporting ATPase 8, plasma membrane-type-like [Brassica napus]|uniref:calcium-transporting ATPase 8, plasma membrane-type-like n=1 Tax=Brassica napus TaxID=3708 RepID=UPI00207A2466|nr:calcium-transporting ATPase 8, plasma membrane-type-like [Brassica napus]
MYRISEDLESGLGGYHVSTAHDAAPEDIEIVIGASADNLESGTNVQDGDSGAHDRRSSWLCTSLMSWRSRPNDDASVRDHPETEPANATGGFVIELDKVVQVVRDRDLQALNQYNGVGGLSTLLKTDLERGIDRRDDEILQRRQAFGSNTYPCKKGKTFWSFVWKACQFPLSLVMIIAVVINSILLRIKRKAIHDGLYVETCAISATVLDIILRAFIEYKHSRQSEKASEEKRNVPQDVIRGGRRLSVCTNDIVVGDIVPLKNGCQVPADGVLFVANSLKIDEQEITGSHLIVQKDILKDPFLLSGSKVIEGIGTMLVTSVGTNTEWGKKIETQPEMDEEKPFQLYVKRLAISASWLVIMLASIACIVQLCRYFNGRTKNSDGTPMYIPGNTTLDEAIEFVIKSLSFGMGTIIVAVPVGLFIAVLLNLANTTRKMMTDNALVQTLSACETMGYVTTILCHKTGILTLNKMSVVDVWAGGIRVQHVEDVSHFPSIPTKLIIEGIAQNTNGSVVFETGVTEPEVYGSPTEQAILNWGNKLGMKFDEARSGSPVLHVIPFNPKNKYGGVALQVGTGHHIHWKGSAKVILNSCQWYMDGANNRIAIGGQRREMEGIIGDMSMRGMRCAALAYQSYELGSLPTTDEELCTLPQDLVLLAIIGMKDPCRPGTRDAVELCKYGGIKVCMVTEDEVSTAQAMAMECGILRDTSGEHIRTAAQFCDLTDLEREQISGDILVLAQASPEDSLLFVKALKRKGYVVAATGMGIHDTKTLHVADVSLAMGIGGTAAAKENSDIIILDDSFASIVKVIQWCRYLYTNIQRYVLFRLTVSVSAVAICVVEVVFYNAFPLNAVQLLLLNLIVDIFGALALAYRPSARKLMGKPPVGIRDHLVTKTMWFKIVIQVIYLVLLLALIHSDSILKLDHGQTADTEKVKNTFIFNSLVFCLVFNEFEIRSGDQTLKEILRDNMFIVTITSTIIFQIILIEFLGIFIYAVRLDLKKWLISILVGFLSQVATRFPLEAYQYYRH